MEDAEFNEELLKKFINEYFNNLSENEKGELRKGYFRRILDILFEDERRERFSKHLFGIKSSPAESSLEDYFTSVYSIPTLSRRITQSSFTDDSASRIDNLEKEH